MKTPIMKKITLISTTTLLITILFNLITFSACKKKSNTSEGLPAEASHPCFDRNLYEASKDAFCTLDCPGVVGCNGKKYCNACEAARVGITVQ